MSEAERLAKALLDWSYREVRDIDRLDAAAELRRLQAENESLRADAGRWRYWLTWMRGLTRKPYRLAREIQSIDAARKA